MSVTTMHDGRVVLHQADCRDVLRSLADNSIDSVVTDPPYALVSIQKRFANSPRSEATENQGNPYGRTGRGFMGKDWDNGETAFSEEFWAEVLRVLKHGGHVLAFSGTRTYHRLAVAVEDAGFEIRDQLGWVYGSGFPKSHNQHGDWEGWGTALKPAWEPICLARKPLAGTVAANLEAWGVGAINVDGCRVATEDALNGGAEKLWSHYRAGEPSADRIYADLGGTNFAMKPGPRGGNPAGRWPANILHDGSDEVIAAFPEAKGQQGDLNGQSKDRKSKGIFGDMPAERQALARIEFDTSAARFFYCAKASRADRDAGLDHLPKTAGGMVSENSGQHITRRDEGYEPVPRANTHPTVKPTTLMQWLCRLITPPGGVILDPFMGSGSTGKAAMLEGFQFVGCEREDEYMPIATARIAWAIGAANRDPVPLPVAPANDNLPVGDLFREAA